MKIVDLTHFIEPDMPVFPGTEAPLMLQANTVEQDHFAEKKITLYSHTGTHMDAPAHMLTGGKTLDAYSAGDFFGPAVLVDVIRMGLPYIGVGELASYEAGLREASFLVLRTGWSEKWGQPGYFSGFPALSEEAARWLIGLGVKGLGVDAISIDRMEDHHFPVHHTLFKAGLFAIENLTHLQELPERFEMACFPLHIKHADGAPARAAAFIRS
ncbi:MAG TPA: cyclase family protein [Anaerolineaceae bacterium]|nr:cyclase family protein [Anaerolineaceae bacterium]HPN50263.1 cyclase family protein [Anaerolineaceae bacterium]